MWYNQFTTRRLLVVSRCVSQGAHRVASRVFREFALAGDEARDRRPHHLPAVQNGGQTCAVVYRYGAHTPLLSFAESWTAETSKSKVSLVSHYFRQPYLERVRTSALVLHDRFWQMVAEVRHPTAQPPRRPDRAPFTDARPLLPTGPAYTLAPVSGGGSPSSSSPPAGLADARDSGDDDGSGGGGDGDDDDDDVVAFEFEHAMPIDFRHDPTYSFVRECRARGGRGKTRSQSGHSYACPLCETWIAEHCSGDDDVDGNNDTPLTLDLLQEMHREHKRRHAPSLAQHSAFRDLCVLARKPPTGLPQLRREQWYAHDGVIRCGRTTVTVEVSPTPSRRDDQRGAGNGEGKRRRPRPVTVLDVARRTDGSTFCVARKTLRDVDGRVVFHGRLNASHGKLHAPCVRKVGAKDRAGRCEAGLALDRLVMSPPPDDDDGDDGGDQHQFFSWSDRDHVAAFVCSEGDPEFEIITLPAMLRRTEPLSPAVALLVQSPALRPPPTAGQYSEEYDAQAERREQEEEPPQHRHQREERQGVAASLAFRGRQERYERQVWRSERQQASRPLHYCMRGRGNTIGCTAGDRFSFVVDGTAPARGPVYAPPTSGDPSWLGVYPRAVCAYLDAVGAKVSETSPGFTFSSRRIVHGRILQHTATHRAADVDRQIDCIVYNGARITVANEARGEHRVFSAEVRDDFGVRPAPPPPPPPTPSSSRPETAGGDDARVLGKSVVFRDAVSDEAGGTRRVRWYRRGADSMLRPVWAVAPVRIRVVSGVQRVRRQMEQRAVADVSADDACRWALQIAEIAYAADPRGFLGDSAPGAWCHVLESKWAAVLQQMSGLAPGPDTDLRNPPGTTAYLKAAFADFPVRVAHLEALGRQTVDLKAAVLQLGVRHLEETDGVECDAYCAGLGVCSQCVVPVDDCEVGDGGGGTKRTDEKGGSKTEQRRDARRDKDEERRRRRTGDRAAAAALAPHSGEEKRGTGWDTDLCERSTRELLDAAELDVRRLETRMRAAGFAGSRWAMPKVAEWMSRHEDEKAVQVASRIMTWWAAAAAASGDDVVTMRAPEENLGDLGAEMCRPFTVEAFGDMWSVEFHTPEVSAFPGWFERVATFFGSRGRGGGGGGKDAVPQEFALRRQDESGRDREGADSNDGAAPSVGDAARGSQPRDSPGRRIYHKLVMGSNGMECAVELEYSPDDAGDDKRRDCERTSPVEPAKGDGRDAAAPEKGKQEDKKKKTRVGMALKRAPSISVAFGRNHKRRIQKGRTLSVVPVLMQDGRMFYVHEYNKRRCTMCETRRCNVVHHCVCRMRACSDCSHKILTSDATPGMRCPECRQLVPHVTILARDVIRRYRIEAANRHRVFTVVPPAPAHPPPADLCSLSSSPSPSSLPSSSSSSHAAPAPESKEPRRLQSPVEHPGSNTRLLPPCSPSSSSSSSPSSSSDTAPAPESKEPRRLQSPPSGEGKEELVSPPVEHPASSAAAFLSLFVLLLFLLLIVFGVTALGWQRHGGGRDVGGGRRGVRRLGSHGGEAAVHAAVGRELH